MLRIRPLLKKESGICPICVLPYVREKRTLRAEYYDQAYDMAVSTLRCPECGYEVILPGFARIRNTTYVKGAAQLPSDVMILPPPAAPEAGKEDTDAVPDGQPEATGMPDDPGEPSKPEETGDAKASKAAETVTAMEHMQNAEPAKGTRSSETGEEHPITIHTAPAAPMDSDQAPVCSGHTEGQKGENPPAQNIQEAPDDPDLSDAGSQPEQKPVPAPVHGQPMCTATEHTKAERTKAEMPAPGSYKTTGPKTEAAMDEKKLAEPAETAKTTGPKGEAEKTGHAAPSRREQEASAGQAKKQDGQKPQKDGQAKERGKENSTQDKKASGGKTLAGKQEGQSPIPGQDRIGGTNKKATGSHVQPAASGASPQPMTMTRDRQAGAFPGSIQSRFSGNGMFRSSPLGTLDALRASVHDDAAQRQKETQAATKGIDAGQMKPDGAGKQASAGNSGKEGQPPAPGKNKGKPVSNVGTDHQRANSGFSADKQNTAQISVEDIRQLLAQKTLPTENPAKQDKKTLSAENPVGDGSIPDRIPAEKSSAQAKKQPDARDAAKDTTNAPKPDGNGKPQKQEDPVKTGKADPATGPVKNRVPAETGGVPDNGEEGKEQGPGDSKETEVDAKTGVPEGLANAAGKDGQPAAGDTEDKHGAETKEGQEDHGGTEDTGDQEDAKSPDEAGQKGQKKHDAGIASKLQEKLPADLVEKLPIFSQISKQQKHAIFASEQKRFLEEHTPHKQVIINDLIYDTDNSEMFLRADGRYGLDNPCVHYNYRTKNGNFFRCTVKFKHEDSIRPLDLIEAKRMLEEYPELYKKFFPDSVSDA